jgi:hypothetical protein
MHHVFWWYPSGMKVISNKLDQGRPYSQQTKCDSGRDDQRAHLQSPVSTRPGWRRKSCHVHDLIHRAAQDPLQKMRLPLGIRLRPSLTNLDRISAAAQFYLAPLRTLPPQQTVQAMTESSRGQRPTCVIALSAPGQGGGMYLQLSGWIAEPVWR